MTLGSPVVVGPVSPCSNKVRVQNQIPGARIDVFAQKISATQVVERFVGSAQATTADQMVPLNPGIQLDPGERVIAWQHYLSDVGPPIPAELAVEVLATPRVEDLAGLYCTETLLECGTCLWIDGVVPGASVTLSINNDPPLQAASETESVKFFLPAGTALNKADSLEASQVACQTAGPTVQLASPVGQVRSQWPISAPKIELPLVECQSVLRLYDVRPGATVIIKHRENEQRACFGYRQGSFRLHRPLAVGDTLVIRQEFPLCELRSRSERYEVKDDLPTPPDIIPPICEGDRLLRVKGLFDDAIVEIESDSGSLCLSGAPGSSATFGIPSLLGRAWVRARQSLCGGNSWSEWSGRCKVRALGPQTQPRIVEPLIAGGVALGVRNVARGALVQIVSPLRVIGQMYGNGDERIDVPLWYPLVLGDPIKVRTVRCGKPVDWPHLSRVERGLDLRPPALMTPLCDCGGSVLVRKVAPGSIVEVFRETSSNSYDFISSWATGARTASVDVPKLSGGELLRAAQRRGAQRSGLSASATAVDPPHWMYEPNSATRLCQLTQDSDPADRPHPVATTQFNIRGTDLGVPIEHEGRLYLFFGDDSVDNWDPIAWLTTSDPDELEDEAPDINWVLNGAGKFHWLSVEGEGLDNFEVPTGGFSYDGRLYVFIGRNKQENPSRMTESILAVRNDPFWDFRTVKQISSTTGGQILVLQPNGSITPAPFPGLRWMLHISATIVQNGDWPGLPESSGEGLLMFGSSAYRGEANATALEQGSGNVYLAWAPLMPGAPSLQAPIPNADEWKFFVGLLQNGMPEWRKLSEGKDPVCILPTLPAGPRNLGEISVVWYPELRRWILAGSGQAPINVARRPWGPWTPCDWICDASRPDRDAGNGNDPQTGVGLWTTFGVSYAPYLIRRWLQWDRSTRSAKLYFTLSGFDDGPGKPKYQPQLIRSTIRCWS